MADEPNKPNDLAPDASGAGTSAPIAKPGSADFDVENASEENLDKHLRMLEKKERARKLSNPEPVVVPAPIAAPVPVILMESPPMQASHALDPIEAQHKVTGELRRFSETTWGLLGDDRQGWQLVVPTPPSLI